MDAELSPLVRRTFSLVSLGNNEPVSSNGSNAVNGDLAIGEKTVLRTEYRATTNRMLRVSVNGFFESMGVVLEVMQELDVDVLAEAQSQAEA